jgi:hypothetical protein
MNPADETAELAPSRDPAAYGHRPVLNGVFWVMIAFCALCLLAAVSVWMLGPRLAPVRQAAHVSAVAPTPTAAPLPLGAAPLAPTTEAAAAPGLDARVQRLETDESRLAQAAAAALAAADLSDAAARPAPFAGELAAAQRLLPGSPDAAALAPLAQEGAPTRAALAAELSNLAGQAAAAARAPGRNASFVDRMLWTFSRVVTLRRVDANASGPDAALAGAEQAADDGDLESALARLDGLPESARSALGPWREKAERRIEIDHRIAGIRAEATAELAAARGGGGAS